MIIVRRAKVCFNYINKIDSDDEVIEIGIKDSEINFDNELLELPIKRSKTNQLDKINVSNDSPSGSNTSKRSSDEDEDNWLEDCKAYTNADTMVQENMAKIIEEMKMKEKLNHKKQAEVVWGETKNMDDIVDENEWDKTIISDKAHLIGMSALSLSYHYVMTFVKNL